MAFVTDERFRFRAGITCVLFACQNLRFLIASEEALSCGILLVIKWQIEGAVCEYTRSSLHLLINFTARNSSSLTIRFTNRTVVSLLNCVMYSICCWDELVLVKSDSSPFSAFVAVTTVTSATKEEKR